MLVEQRFIWIDKVEIDNPPKADIISFGSESCTTPVFYVDKHWTEVKRLINTGKRVKIVTPRVAQSDLPGIASLIEKAGRLQQTVDIVVNDWGLLQLCAAYKEVLHIHLGRQLCRTLLDCPWHKEILAKESNQVREIMISHPFSSRERLNELQKKGIMGLELNYIFQGYDLQPMKDLNFEVAVHYENYLLTCGRTCLTKRVMKNNFCRNTCELEFQLEPSGKWLNYFQYNEPFNDYEKSLLAGMAFSGKKVILPQKISTDELSAFGAGVLITTKAEQFMMNESGGCEIEK